MKSLFPLILIVSQFDQAFAEASYMYIWPHALAGFTSLYSEGYTIGATIRAIRSRNNHRPGRRTVLGESIVVESWCSIRMSI